MTPIDPSTTHPGAGSESGTLASHLGLGLAALGRPAYITTGRASDLGPDADRSVEALRRHAHEVLDAAWWLGIRYVDAARSYGLAEQFLGSWLAAHPGRRDELTIGSKWGYEYVGDWSMSAEVHERKEHDTALFDRQWPETLEALGGRPDVYLIHSLTPDSPALTDSALLDRLRGLTAEGVRIGFSTSGPSQAAVIDAALALRDSPFSAVQSTWNLLEPSAGSALARANDARWLVVVKEALANGRLTEAGALTGDGPADPHAQAARVAAERDSQTLESFALGAAVAQPWADVVLTGAVTRRQLRENLRAQPPAPGADLTHLAEPAAVYWAARSARPWT
ncbi:aldo/keto reductase [Herbiconiux moechotypicola]|uniref:Aldo/keto reductase n=1 Tax=Herbiconiux moechotypicola TaxID=637393 RepID=A0ABP5QS30_9MICO|nr:aldo/keto reductase [Herbiconiux moechotypicola]MCS5730736.1 aldo/keto reductase [Herbiconiux moechotypicola]